MTFGENLVHSFFEILKISTTKNELSRFIPNFPLKHVITSTNISIPSKHHYKIQLISKTEVIKKKKNDIEMPRISWKT